MYTHPDENISDPVVLPRLLRVSTFHKCVVSWTTIVRGFHCKFEEITVKGYCETKRTLSKDSFTTCTQRERERERERYTVASSFNPFFIISSKAAFF